MVTSLWPQVYVKMAIIPVYPHFICIDAVSLFKLCISGYLQQCSC